MRALVSTREKKKNEKRTETRALSMPTLGFR
jgi:hypothetical protein